MDLEQQIQELVEHAPQDGESPDLVRAIAPVLRAVSQQLRHLQYYIVQTLDESWAVTTLSNQTTPDEDKTVIYAYPSLKDVTSGPYPMQDPSMIAVPVPVTHILFQMLALEPVFSTIFFETPGSMVAGTEVQRDQLVNLIQLQLQQSEGFQGNSLPPDIA